MAIIRPSNQQTVMPQGGGAYLPGGAPPAEAFGNISGAVAADRQGRDLQVAGAYLEKASNSVETIALQEMRDANEARVQDLANGFMSGTQFTLYTDKDAFYRKRGQEAINGAQSATDRLIELKKDALGLAANEYQKQRLSKIIDAQLNDATNGISRHVAQQSVEWQKTVAQGRQQLLNNQAALDFPDAEKIDVLALAAESTAREQAKQAGVTGTDQETAMVTAARSNIYTTAISQRLQNDQKRAALALYSKVKDKLDDKDNIKLASAIKSTATDVEAEDWIARNSPNNLPAGVKQYQPLIQKAAADYGVDPKLVSAVMAVESGGRKEAVSPAGARGLMQIMPGTATDLGVKDPHDPDQAVPGGAKYLAQNLAKFNGDTKLALMAYNWGPANVDKWVKAGSDPEKVPQETRDYVQKVSSFIAGQSGVGFDKANTQGLVLAALNDPGISMATKSAIATKITKESTALEASRSATIKGARDMLEATTQAMIVSPGTYKKGTLGTLADTFDAAGEKSEATNTRVLASMEDTLLNFSAAPKGAQEETMRTVAAALLPGKGKALAESLIAANKKDAAELGKMAGEDLAALKTAAASGVRMETLESKARGVVDGFVKANDFTKAREVADFYDAQVKAQAVGQAPPAALASAIADMRTRIEKGEQSNLAIRQLDAMQDVQRKQAAAFDKDALATGATIYSKDLGPLPPMTDLAARAAYATSISKLQGGRQVLPFTEPEIEGLRTRIDQAPPEQQAKIMATLSTLPPETIPGVAAALAGKKDAGDPLSRSYAAALSFYAEKDPISRQVADQILGGAEIQKKMGEAGKKAPVSSDAWQAALQERMGSVFFDMKGMPAVVADAVASVYTYQMHRAGRQGEKIDGDVLDKAITTVMGNTVSRNGQAFLPPVRGMDTYEVDRAVRSITDADVAALRTQEGDPITADVLIRAGRLTNAGKDGIYFVRIPDPRAGGDLRPVVDADGNAWRLDLRPFVERSKTAPPAYSTDEGKPTQMRRRPVVPTLNDVAP